MRARTTSWGRRATLRTAAAAAGTALLALSWIAATSPAQSSSVIVTTEVLSTVELTNDCVSDQARSFGTVLPGGNALTSTGAGVCRISFGSTRPAQLRIGQSDGIGNAMGFGTTEPVQQTGYRAPGRTLGVFGIDGTTASAVGRANTAYRTTNGGTAWTGYSTAPSGNHEDLESLPGTPATTWIVGATHSDQRSIYRSNNALAGVIGSVIWTDETAALDASGWQLSARIHELTIPTTGAMYIAGDDGWLGRCAIGSAPNHNCTWTSFQTSGANADLDLVAIDAVDAVRVIAVSANGWVTQTSTGATSAAGWTTTKLPGSPTLITDVAAASATRAYAVGTDGYLAVWDGTTWTDRSDQLALPRDLMGVDSIPGSPDSLVVVDGDGVVHRSDSAGMSPWTSAPTHSASRTGDIHAATATDIYVVAAERSISSSHDGGLTWDTWQPPTPIGAQELTGITASPVNGQRIMAVSATAFTSVDGGASWSELTIEPTTSQRFAMRDVTMVDDTDGWVVGDKATIYRTDDFGVTWAAQSAPAGVTASLWGVTASDDLRATAVGDDGTIIATSNGGTSWTSRASGTTRHLTSIDSFGTLQLAVGARGTVLRSTDRGVTWTPVPGGSLPSASADLLDVAVLDDRVAYATTRSAVWRTSNAGVTWTLAGTPTGIRIRSLAAAGRTVVVVGYDDQVAFSTDDGATFATVPGGTGTMHLGAVSMVDSHTAVIAGADERRLRMTVDTTPDVLVPNWAPGSNDWDTGGFFGVCLQAVGGAAIADWTRDTMNVSGQCETKVTDPWRAVPAIATQAAHTAALGTGNVDLVWGFRPAANQRPGTYEAGVAFEAIAP